MKKVLFLLVALVMGVTSVMAAFTPVAGTKYVIKHVKSGLFLKFDPSVTENAHDNVLSLANEGSEFTIESATSGFSFYCEDAGEYLTTQGSLSWNPGHSASASYWQIQDAQGGYYLKKNGSYYCAPDGMTVGSYIYTDKAANNSNGSVFDFIDVETLKGTVTFTVNVIGNPDGGVTYEGHNYTNGQTLEGPAAILGSISALGTEGYIYSLKVEGDIITVTYTNVSEWVVSATTVNPYKAYTIATPAERGALTVTSAEATGLAGTAGSQPQEIDPSNVLQQFAFISYNEGLYLYSVGAQKFVSISGLTEEPTDVIDFADYDATDATVRLRFDASHNFNLGGGDIHNFGCDTWNTKDIGNSFMIVPAANFDPTAILNALNGINNYTVNITGAPEGTTVIYNGQEYGNGETIEATGIINAEQITTTTIEGYNVSVNIEGTNINVTYTEWPTWTVSISGAEGSIEFGGQTYTNGQTFKAAEVTVADITVNAVEGYKYALNIEGTTITVAYSESREFAPKAGELYTIKNVETNLYLGFNTEYEDNHNVVNATALSAEGAQFSFEVAEDGFYIFNDEAGEYLTIGGPGLNSGKEWNTGHSSDPYKWIVTESDTEGLYYICKNSAAETGKWYMGPQATDEGSYVYVDNQRSAANLLWEFVLVAPLGDTYTVNIAGAPEGTTVTINGNTYTNGQTLVATDLTAEQVEPATVEGMSAQVEINEFQINVTYTEWPTWTVVILGPTTAKVTYNGTEYKNGATFKAESVEESEFTPSAPTGYDGATVTINEEEHTVTVSCYINVEVSALGVSTFYNDKTMEVPTGLTAYTATENGNYLVLHEITDGIIPAKAGVVVMGEAGTYNIGCTAEEATAESGVLKGVTRSGKTPTGCCTLAQENDKLGFYHYTGTQVAAHKAYYVAPAGINGMAITFEGTEGISTAISTQSQKAAFDLQGRRVNGQVKGLLILNGKKVIK